MVDLAKAQILKPVSKLKYALACVKISLLVYLIRNVRKT